MNLRDYLHHYRIKAKDMAAELGISYTYFRTLKNEANVASFELATKIEILTGGQVTIKELRNGIKD